MQQKFMPFWGSRIFWIALVVIAAFTAMIVSGQLALEGAAVTAFLLAVFSGVVGLSRREQGDAGPPGSPAIPPELATALTSLVAGMTAREPEPEAVADDDEGDDEDVEDEESKEGDDAS